MNIRGGGGIKILPRGLQNTPPLLALNMPSAQKWGEGGEGRMQFLPG